MACHCLTKAAVLYQTPLIHGLTKQELQIIILILQAPRVPVTRVVDSCNLSPPEVRAAIESLIDKRLVTAKGDDLFEVAPELGDTIEV